MSEDEHERLLRGQFFLQWSDWDDQELRIPPGSRLFSSVPVAALAQPPERRPRDEFEVGFWTFDSLNARKVYDVNWLLRRRGPRPGGARRRARPAKRRVFDAFSTITRKGTKYRGL